MDRIHAGTSLRSKPIQPRLSVNGSAAAIDAALRGFGLARVHSYQVQEDLSGGRLTRLRDYEPPPVPLNLLFHPHPATRASVRSFIDFATPRLKRELGGVV
jgi:DNA-binding transcriptional LysR family regulator